MAAAGRFGDRWKRLVPRSLRARLTVVAMLSATLLFMCSSTLILALVPKNVQDAAETRAELTARRVAGQARSGHLPPHLHSAEPAPGAEALAQVVAPDGRVLAASYALEGAGRICDLEPEGFENADSREQTLRLPAKHRASGDEHLVAALRTRSPRGPVVVYSAVNVTDLNRSLTALYAMVYVGTPFAVLVVGLVAWIAAGATLRPVARIRRRLEEISGRQLDRRVPVPESGDEIERLAATTNATLTRLQRSAEAQRRFVADASHELRSPISALHTQLEVDAQYPEETDWPAANQRALAAVERLAEIVDELLTLARMDAGARPERRPVDLARIAGLHIRRREHERVPVYGDLAGEARVLGAPAQLDRLLTNLLDNAVRHARSRVDVRVAVEDDEVVVEVLDDGSGIAPEDRERVFERFTRLKEGRRLDRGGSGLGLSLAREIATAHGGELGIADSRVGARFVLRLPLAPEGGATRA